jgi:hypothetical protein
VPRLCIIRFVVANCVMHRMLLLPRFIKRRAHGLSLLSCYWAAVSCTSWSYWTYSLNKDWLCCIMLYKWSLFSAMYYVNIISDIYPYSAEVKYE